MASLLQAAAQAGSRSADPVVISAESLADFLTKPITSVVLYAYDDGWQPIPFQIDERTIEPDDTVPDYVSFEDGLIDANDELVFMAKDMGSAESSWPADPNASSNPRARIDLVDPLSQASGVVYLFDSTTLPRSATSYVSLDLATESVNAISYTLGLNSSSVIGLDALTLNGQPTDVIDRQKIRVTAGSPPFVLTRNEEDLVADLNFSPFTSIVSGPVRLIEGGDFGSAYYGSRFDVAFAVDIDAINAQLPFGSVQSVRVSLDLNDPAGTGINAYQDSNGASATVDGAADAAVTTALRDWYQVSGAGQGGLVVTIPELSITGGTISSYYEDNATPSGDTGDGKQFADTGIEVTSPSGQLRFAQVNYVLAPTDDGASGAAYFQQATMPLSATVSAETTTPTQIVLTEHAAAASTSTIILLLVTGLIGLSWRFGRKHSVCPVGSL